MRPRQILSGDIKKRKPPGPPSPFKPEYCDIAREELAKIHSIVAVAARLGVHRGTLYEWRKIHPDFDRAIVEGQQIGEAKFEKIAVDNLPNKNFNALLWCMLGRKLYAVPETRLITIPGLDQCKTYEEEVNCIRNAVAHGHITTKEGNEASNIIATKAKMYELMEAKKMLEEMQAQIGKNKTKK